MSARVALVATVLARLKAGELPQLFDAPPVRAALPHVVIEEPILSDWSSATWRGVEGRVIITVHDGGEQAARVRRMMGDVEYRLMPGFSIEGWHVAQWRWMRSQMVRIGAQWRARGEWQVKMHDRGGL